MPLDSAAFDPLSTLIGDSFDPPELDTVLRQTTGAGLYKAWVAQGKPVRDTVLDLLKKLSDRGVERVVLAAIAARRPADAALIAAIASACPAALEQIPSTEAQVGSLLTGLAAIRARLGDASVRAALSTSASALRTVADTVNTLNIYKNIHDTLHQFQFSETQDLRHAARSFATDETQSAVLVQYQGQLQIMAMTARTWIEQLPQTSQLRQMELSWLTQMEGADQRLNAALTDRETTPAQIALTDIHRLMSIVPSRLNEQIVVAAEALPLGDLAAALAGLSTALTDDIAKAQASLSLVRPTLDARVAEHKSWQEIDNKIRYLDELLDHSGPDALAEFTIYWPDLKQHVLDLAAFDTTAPWARDTKIYSDRLDDLLARDLLDAPLIASFANVSVKARLRFLMVDKTLKSDCGQLATLSAPLQAIVTELDHDP